MRKELKKRKRTECGGWAMGWCTASEMHRAHAVLVLVVGVLCAPTASNTGTLPRSWPPSASPHRPAHANANSPGCVPCRAARPPPASPEPVGLPSPVPRTRPIPSSPGGPGGAPCAPMADSPHPWHSLSPPFAPYPPAQPSHMPPHPTWRPWRCSLCAHGWHARHGPSRHPRQPRHGADRDAHAYGQTVWVGQLHLLCGRQGQGQGMGALLRTVCVTPPSPGCSSVVPMKPTPLVCTPSCAQRARELPTMPS